MVEHALGLCGAYAFFDLTPRKAEFLAESLGALGFGDGLLGVKEHVLLQDALRLILTRAAQTPDAVLLFHVGEIRARHRVEHPLIALRRDPQAVAEVTRLDVSCFFHELRRDEALREQIEHDAHAVACGVPSVVVVQVVIREKLVAREVVDVGEFAADLPSGGA